MRVENMRTYRMKHSSRRYTLVYQKEEEGGYSGHCLELPSAISQAETIEELRKNIGDAIRLILDDMKREEAERKQQTMKITVSV
jgi:predicted RNase H-like HicB family nuclease